MELPRRLVPYRGSLPSALVEAVVEGQGDRAGPVRQLAAAGLVPPDLLAGMTLLLLSHQPRRAGHGGEARPGAVEGGVWVREQFTCHAPVRIDQPLVVTGDVARRFSRGGRRYGVNRSQTRDEAGRLLVSSCTTGLLSYRRDPDLADGEAGLAGAALAVAGPDAGAAAGNPHLTRLRAVGTGEVFEQAPVRVTLEMMRRRDGGRNENRIHTDPEVAARAGLAAPIAGGSHVLAFVQGMLLEAWGLGCLSHGAHFDVRWVGQTRAGSRIAPRVAVTRASPSGLACRLEVRGEDRAAMEGSLVVPLAGGGG